MIRTTLTLIYGALAALISCGLVLGAISLSLVEGGSDYMVIPFNDQATPSSPVQDITSQESPSEEIEPVCVVPAGWIPYTTQTGDTLASLAEAYGMQADDLKAINCYPVDQLFPGVQLFLPPNATSDGPSDANTPTTISDPPTN
jgi:LysM repeat protein